MDKIEIFYDENPFILKNSINEFIEQDEIIVKDIKFLRNEINEDYTKRIRYSVLILYCKKDEVNYVNN